MTEEIIINNECFIASQTDLKEYMDNITKEELEKEVERLNTKLTTVQNVVKACITFDISNKVGYNYILECLNSK